MYDPDEVTPGYWFVASYDFLDQSLVNGGKWTAPHIFDRHGELIWSGAVCSKASVFAAIPLIRAVVAIVFKRVSISGAWHRVRNVLIMPDGVLDNTTRSTSVSAMCLAKIC